MANAKKEESVEVVPFASSGNLPADFGAETEGLGGLGYSEKSEDSLVPILSILQDNSGEVKKNHSRRIDGAEPGYLIIRALKKVIDPSSTPVVVQPCAFQHVWVAWLGDPGEGRVTGVYPFDDVPKDAKTTKMTREDGSEQDVLVMPDGSRLADTRYHYCRMYLDGQWSPIVIPMAGTNHGVSRGWTNLMKAARLPNGAKAPAWFRAYQIDAHFNQRGAQSWFNFEIKKDLGWINDLETIREGREVFESVNNNTISADVASESASDDDGGDDSVPI